jgi:hypothetical protein
MKTMILAAALALATPAWSQGEAAKSAEAKSPPKAAKMAKKASSKRHQDARHCLQRASNDAIIKCAEAYL